MSSSTHILNHPVEPGYNITSVGQFLILKRTFYFYFLFNNNNNIIIIIIIIILFLLFWILERTFYFDSWLFIYLFIYLFLRWSFGVVVLRTIFFGICEIFDSRDFTKTFEEA
jgi:hypothetical protein